MKQKKKLVKDLIYSLFLGGKEYETELTKTSPLPKTTILITLILTALVLALVFSFIEISALTSDIGDLKKEEVSLTSREGKLSDDLGHKYPYATLLDEIEAMGFAAKNGETVILPAESEEIEN